MNKSIFFFATLLLTITTYAQNNFEEGYYIDSNKNRITGYIQVENWNSNPKKITFKLSEMGPQQDILSRNMNGFGIGNSIQYDKYTVKISKASDNIEAMDRVRKFNLVEETAMLKLLVDGEAQLYNYSDQGVTQYFIKEGNLLTSLLYKRYLTDGGLASNNQYQQQLSNLFICDSGKLPSVESLRYTESSLVKYVTKYNECNGSLNQTFKEEESKNFLAVKIFGGLQNSSLSVNSNTIRTFDYGNKNSFVPGLELELRFPTPTTSEWSVFLDFRLHSFEETGQYAEFTNFVNDEVITRNTTGSYNAVDVGIGGRYYFGLGEHSKVYVGMNMSVDIINDTSFTYEGIALSTIDGKAPTLILGLGVGYNWKNLSAEARYHTNRDSVGGEFNNSNSSEYSNIALTISYALFNLSF